MLVTLDLICTNIYNVVSAPIDRKISYVEIWMIGVHFPIFIAILEYGIILAMKKYEKAPNTPGVHKIGNIAFINTKDGHFDVSNFSKNLDMITFFLCLIFIILFNMIYWSVAFQK